jgi:hypothetical protein
MAENVDPSQDALKQQELQKRNEALGLPSDFDPNKVLNSPQRYNNTPQSGPVRKQVIGNPATGPAPGKGGRVAVNNKRVVLDNSEFLDGVRSGIQQTGYANYDPKKLMQPYSYNGDHDGYAFERYYKHDNFKTLGFSPYKDNETAYNQTSTFGDEMGRATVEWGNLLWTGVKSGITTWGDLFSGTSPLAPDLKTARNMERSMAIGSSSKGGATEFAVNNWLNSGHSIGVGIEWLAEEFALAALTAETAGLAGMETLPAMGASATKAYKGIRGGFGLFDAYKTGKKSLNAYRELRNVNEMRTFWNSTRAGKALSATGRIVNPLGNTIEAFKGIKYADDGYKAVAGINTFGAFAKDMLQVKSAVTEARLEGGLVQLDAEQKMIDEFRVKNGRDPVGKEIEDMHKIASGEGFRAALWNVPIIMLSNKVLHETLFKNLKPSKPKVGDALIDESGAFTVFTKEGFKTFEGKLGERIGLGAKALVKPKTYGKFLKGYMSANLAEGLQENLQETVSGAAIDHALATYNNKNRGGYESFMGNIFENFGKQFSAQGAETFASGLLMGAISGPIMAAPMWTAKQFRNQVTNREGYKEYKKNRFDQMKKTSEYLNEMYKNPTKYFSPEMRNAVAQGKIAEDLYEAIEYGDFKGAKNAQDFARVEAVYTALRTQNYDTLLDRFKEMKNLSPEEMEQANGLEKGEGAKALQMMDSFIARAEKIKARYEYVNDNLSNPYDYTQYKEGTERRRAMEYAYQGFEEMKRSLIFGYATYDRNNERIEDMVNSMASISKPLSKVAATEFTNLMDPASLDQELKLLKSEIDTMDKMKDTLTPEDQKELASKKRKRELLENFSKKMDQAEFAYDKELYDMTREALLKQGLDLDKTSIKRDENGNWSKGTYVHDTRKGINEENGVAQIVDSDSTGYLLSNGEFVSRDEVEPVTASYLQDLMQIDATEESREAYREYLKFLADQNGDFVMNDKLEESFQLLLDWRAKNKENVNLVRYINYLNDPRAMLENGMRVAKAYSQAHQDRLKATISRMSEAVKKYEFNKGIQELYKDGWFVEEQSYKDLVNALRTGSKEMPVPKSFIKVTTGETFKEGTPEYAQALKKWNENLPAIVETFKDQVETEEKEKKTVEEVIDDVAWKDFVDNNKVAPEVLNTIAQKIVNGEKLSERENAILGEKTSEVEDIIKDIQTKQEPTKSEVVTPDMTYDQYPEGLKKLLDPLYQKYLSDNNITTEEATDEMRDNWLGSVTASRVITQWNKDTKKREMEEQLLGKRRKASEPPTLLSVTLPKGKTLNDYTIPELQDMLTKLQADQKASPSSDKESDIKALSDYIGYRKGVAITTAGTAAQQAAVDKLKQIQNQVINKDNEDRSYLIENKAYTRATTVVGILMDAVYNYKRKPFENSTEANIVTTAAKTIIDNNGTPADFIAELRKSAINDVVLGRYNKRKLDLIQKFLETEGLTEENVLKIFDKYQHEHTTIRGNNVDKHIREFFETGQLGPRPSYFSEKAYNSLDQILKDIRDKFVAQGYVVVANDLTVFDDEALVAGTLDLLLIDKNGNYVIYDIKTGTESKWRTYENSEAGMPHSASMMENGFQLSIYKALLQNQTGIDVKALGILPIQVKEDLDGNILDLSTPRKDTNGKPASIKIEYAPQVEELIPLRTPKPAKTSTTQVPTQETPSNLITAEAQVKYFKDQLTKIRGLMGLQDNRLRDIETSLDKEAEELEDTRKKMLDLQTFVDKASPKELKGKKRKIKAEIKKLQDRIKELEDNYKFLTMEQAKLANTRKRLDMLETTVLDAIDELPKDVTKKVEGKSVGEFIRERIAGVQDILNERAQRVEQNINTVEDRIQSIRASLVKLGMTDALIDLYLEGNFNTQYLRDKLASGSLTQEETESYRALLDNLTKKPGAEFRTEFKTLTRDLSKSYIERAKLQFDLRQIAEQAQVKVSPFEVDTKLEYLSQALQGLIDGVEFLKEEQAKKPTPEAAAAIKPKKPAPKAPTAPVESTAKADYSSYVGKMYIAPATKITYKVVAVEGDNLIVIRESDNQTLKWSVSTVKAQETADNPIIVEYIKDDEEAEAGQQVTETGTTPIGIMSFTDNNPELIINGQKKLTNRKHGLDKDGVYTIQRKDMKTNEVTPTNIEVTVTKLGEATVNREGVVPEVRVQGDHTEALKQMGIPSIYNEATKQTIIEADEYAKAEGFKDWADFEANNKYSKNFINGSQPRFIFTVSPVKPAGEVKEETPKKERSKKDVKKLKSIGMPQGVIDKLTDAEFEQALTFNGIEEAKELIVKYHVPKPKESITLEQAKEMIDSSPSVLSLKELYSQLEYAASLDKVENPDEVEAYYQQKLAERMNNPVAESLEVGSVVEVNGEVYKVTSVGANVSLKQVAGNDTMNVPAQDASSTISRILDPTVSAEVKTEVSKEETKPVQQTIEESAKETAEQKLKNREKGKEYSQEDDEFNTYKKKPC